MLKPVLPGCLLKEGGVWGSDLFLEQAITVQYTNSEELIWILDFESYTVILYNLI